VGFLERFLEEITAWAATERASGGERLLDKPWVQANLAKVHAGLEVLRVMNWRQAWAMSQGDLPAQDASMIKIYGSEFYVEANRLLMEVLGDVATLQRDSPAVVLQGRLERYYRGTLVLTFGGGANEIQRDIISMVGLRMPRPPR
jgi:alkylation response protein AidB-like acyl-CoA dehydrogenase